MCASYGRIVDGLWIDPAAARAGVGDRLLQLSASDVAVLAALAEANGRVLGRQEIMRRAQLGGSSERRCEPHLVAIRRALGDDAVRNVRGRGWALTLTATVHRAGDHHRTSA